MISSGNCRASCIANADLPQAVGPTNATADGPGPVLGCSSIIDITY
jgi:hypothetical protein